jgi:uncharacterized protein with von Willebrand factor type A (vWA) domain
MELQEANATKDEFLARLAERTEELDRVNRELRVSEHATRQLAEELQESLSRERAAREAAENNEHRSLILSEASRILSSSLEVNRTLANLVRLAATSIGEFCAIHVVCDGHIERVDAAHADPSRQELIQPFKTFAPLASQSSGTLWNCMAELLPRKAREPDRARRSSSAFPFRIQDHAKLLYRRLPRRSMTVRRNGGAHDHAIPAPPPKTQPQITSTPVTEPLSKTKVCGRSPIEEHGKLC